MSIEKLIHQKIVQDARSYFENYLGRKLNKKREASFRPYVKSMIAPSDRGYSNFTIKNHKLEKLITAFLVPDLGVDFIMVSHLYYTNAPKLQELRTDLESIQKYFAKVKKIKIALDENNKYLLPLLTKLHYVEDCVEFVGRIGDGLEALKDVAMPEGLSFRPMNYKRDIEAVIKIDNAAHKKDGTSVVKKYSKKRELDMREHFKKMCKIGSCFVAVHQQTIVGSIGTYPNKTLALIGNISVDPKYWNRGIGKALYRHALEDLKARKNTHYKGYTSTHKVLAIGKRLKRRTSFTILQKETNA